MRPKKQKQKKQVPLNDFIDEKRGEAPNGDYKVVAGSRTNVFEFYLLLIRAFPPDNGHRDIVRAA